MRNSRLINVNDRVRMHISSEGIIFANCPAVLLRYNLEIYNPRKTSSSIVHTFSFQMEKRKRVSIAILSIYIYIYIRIVYKNSREHDADYSVATSFCSGSKMCI